MKEPQPRPFVWSHATLAGIGKAFGLKVEPLPEGNTVNFRVHGDVEAVLRKIAANEPVGSRDVLEAINAVRSMIFTFKGTSR